MKLIRVFIVAVLTVSCSRASTPERTDHKSDDTAPAAATSGETGQPAATREPATQPSQGEKPVAALTPVAEQAKATGVNPDAAVLADFKSRIDAYMKLRKEAVKDAPRLKETKGVGVAQVTPGSAADRAGLRKGDVITSFNGVEMTDPNVFRNLVASTAPGTDVTLTIIRDGREQQIRAKLGELVTAADRETERPR